MSFWKYCSCKPYGPDDECRRLDWPTAAEKLAGILVCDRCGEEHEVEDFYRVELFKEMIDDIETLKKTVGILTRAVKALAAKAA